MAKNTGGSQKSDKAEEKKPGSSGKTAAAEKKPSSTKKSVGEEKKQGSPKKSKSENGEAGEARSSCKTEHVMKLVAPDKGKNPVITAGKSRIPGQLKGREPLSRMLKREVKDGYPEREDTEVVNITELAVQFEAPQILDRFNACSCDKCVRVFSEIVMKKVPARFARISKSNLGIRSKELYGKVEPMKKVVQTAMIRELIGSRKRMFHDE